jgi:hypothetical protein
LLVPTLGQRASAQIDEFLPEIDAYLVATYLFPAAVVLLIAIVLLRLLVKLV